MLVTIVFTILLIAGVPITFVLGLAGAYYMFTQGVDLLMVPQRMFVQIDSFVLGAVPLFMLAGNLFSEGGFTSRILRLSNALIGHIRGGLGYVNVLASMLFAGISGSALADVFGLGPIEIALMTEGGYDKEFSAAVTAVSAILGPIIPPSIIMVVLGAMGNISIAALLLGGILPGILLGLGMMLVVGAMARIRNYPKADKAASLKEIYTAIKDSILAIVAPFIILGGIFFGVFTPTEAAVVAVVYALFISLFVYKEVKLADLPRILFDSAVSTSCCFLIISTAGIFSWILAIEEVPIKVVSALLSVSGDNPIIVLILINILLLFMGTWMDITATLIILAPLLLPVAEALGMNLIHFGVMMVVNLEIGQVTPPLGLCLFGAAQVADLSVESVVKELIPFILVCIAVLFIIAFVPNIVLFIPSLIMNK